MYGSPSITDLVTRALDGQRQPGRRQRQPLHLPPIGQCRPALQPQHLLDLGPAAPPPSQRRTARANAAAASHLTTGVNVRPILRRAALAAAGTAPAEAMALGPTAVVRRRHPHHRHHHQRGGQTASGTSGTCRP
jgi:hypothetical protein